MSRMAMTGATSGRYRDEQRRSRRWAALVPSIHTVGVSGEDASEAFGARQPSVTRDVASWLVESAGDAQLHYLGNAGYLFLRRISRR